MRLAARLVLGVLFFLFGLDGFFHVLELPVSARGQAFLDAIHATGYFWPFLKGTETLCGALLLANRLVPLALTVLAPIAIHILLFHVFLDHGGIPIGLVLVGLDAYVAWCYRDRFRAVVS